ncbi:AraC family transcriptional regulator [Microlunatus soli]|uniref:AraC-type DNA-binding protein n=1 Tax=Microlunatus soli TaxID=630515 RepID=A0A1H1SKN3_9ACTN|nr:AraC family transcriptional regulator [Microlunatus soli]SDS47919.1 AraC-type DNA-binding protein [Microlunatus soli]
MARDELSEVFDLIEVRSLLSGGFAARGPWVSHAPIEDALKFVAVVCGRARLLTDGLDSPIDLETGDVAILNDRHWVELVDRTAVDGSVTAARPEVMPEADFSSTRLVAADRTLDDVIVGGRVDLNDAGRTLLLQALPPVAHVRAAAAAGLRDSLDRLFDEVTASRMGSAFAIRQYGQLLLLEVLRAYVEQTDLPPGWLLLLSDERLRPALSIIHGEPGRPAGLEDLARAAGMSRTSFAERFRTVAGVPPLTYLSRWRMLLAQRALRHGDVGVGSLASELGYASESAFSTAFKREVGESPLRYRRRIRQQPAAG